MQYKEKTRVNGIDVVLGFDYVLVFINNLIFSIFYAGSKYQVIFASGAASALTE